MIAADRYFLRGVFALVIIGPFAISAQEKCPAGDLPAYSHNDYQNARPLTDALALGYRGAEADIFLVDGVFRVGHDRASAQTGGSFEALYLAPLRALVKKCGALRADNQPFLLTVEVKESSLASFDSLSALLSRYADISNATHQSSPIEVVLVGWSPSPDELSRRHFELASLQYLIGKSSGSRTTLEPDRIRLVSLDYGKTAGRWWSSAKSRKTWLDRALSVKREKPDRLLRIFNVPVDAKIYTELLASGADLIGTKTLARSRWALIEARRE